MQTSVPVGTDPLGDEPRVAAGAEGAVDRDLARARARQIDQLTGEHGYVRARHVKKDCQGAPSPPRSPRRGPPAPPASASCPRPRGGPPRRPRRPPSRCPRARATAAAGHAAARVEVDLERVPLVEARQLAVLGAHRVEAAERPLDDRLVRLGRPHRDAGLGVLGEHRPARERGAEPGGNGQPVLCIQRVLEVAAKRQGSCPREELDRSGGVGRSPATPVVW